MKLTNKKRFRFIAFSQMKYNNPTWKLKYQIRKGWDDEWDAEFHHVLNMYMPCKRLKYFK